MVKVTNGVIAYMSPNGDNANDGLTMLTPKKSIYGVLNSIENVETIIFLEGEYVSGVNYFDSAFGQQGQVINQPINFIGLGKVIFNNLNNYPIKFENSVYCENIHFKGGNNCVVVNHSSRQYYSVFNHCTFSNSYTLNGLALLGGLGCD